jgi:hypothetical protein
MGERTPGRDDHHEAAMTEDSGYRGRRQTRGRLQIRRTTAARCGAVATFIALTILTTSTSAMGAPLLQAATDAADLEPPISSAAPSEASRMAAIMAVVNRQGVQGPLNLKRVSAVAVSNLMTEPELVVDARAKRAAEAEAAAAAIALTVQATVEAQEAEATAAASATAEAEAKAAASVTAAASATAAAEATAAAIATETARDSAHAAAVLAAKQEAAAVLSAKQEAAVRAAEVTATRNAQTLAAASVAINQKMSDQMSLLLIALTPMLGGALGFRLWRSRKEPFVLKANPVPARSSAPA